MDRKQPEDGILPEDRVVIGRIVKPHGVRGELKMIPLTNVAGRFQPGLEVIVEFGDGHLESRSIEQVRGVGKTIIELSGIDSREEAERFPGSYITVPRSQLPKLEEDTFYAFDLIGMKAIDSGGETVGSVFDIESYPANDVLVLEGGKGEIMVPLVRDYVLKVDMAARTITVRLPEMLPPAVPEKTD